MSKQKHYVVIFYDCDWLWLARFYIEHGYDGKEIISAIKRANRRFSMGLDLNTILVNMDMEFKLHGSHS